MAGKSTGLGRGLDALFGDSEIRVPAKTTKAGGETGKNTSKTAEGNAYLYVDIDEIKPNKEQPRQVFDQDKLEGLAASIETSGVIQPLILTKAKTGYELVSGERRWRAARIAGLKKVPATVCEVTDEQKALFAIIENMQREDLNTIEEAAAYQAMIQNYGMTQEGLSKAVGKSRPHIANTLRTLGMPAEIIEFLRNGELTLGHANALGSIKDEKRQLVLARKIVKSGLSVREAERLAGGADKKSVKTREKSANVVEILAVEQELTSATGIRVKIKGSDNKGRVELQYFDRQGLEEIIDLLRGARTRKK